MLLSVISSASWTNKRREIVAAGLLSDRLETLVSSRPVYRGEVVNNSPVDQIMFATYRAEVKAWEREVINADLTDAEFQACVTCLRHYSDDKKIPSNIYGAWLLEAFRLAE